MNVPSVGVDAMSVPLPIMRGKKEWDNIFFQLKLTYCIHLHTLLCMESFQQHRMFPITSNQQSKKMNDNDSTAVKKTPNSSHLS